MSRPRRRCGVCPIWGQGWCAHLAKRQSPTAPACDYGLREMQKQYFRNYFAKRRNQKKNGNGAKMREVLVRVSHMNDDGYYNGQYSITEIVDMAKAALAEPPRNCDRYTGEDLDRDVADAYARADKDLMLDYDREDLPIRWLLSTSEQVEAYKKKFLEELKICGKAVRGEK